MSVLVAGLSALIFLAAWRHALPGGFLVWQGLAAALLAGALEFAWVLRRQRRQPPGFGRRARDHGLGGPFKDGLLAALLVHAFVVAVPTTAERSPSLRLMARIARAPDGVSEQQLTADFPRDVASPRAVKQRLEEQRATGTLLEDHGTWRLTPAGRQLVDVADVACVMFACASGVPR